MDGHPTPPDKRQESVQAPNNLYSAVTSAQEHKEHHGVSPSHFDSGFWKHVQLGPPDQLDSALEKISRPDRPTSTSISSETNFLPLQSNSLIHELQNKNDSPLADQSSKHYQNTINEIYAKFDGSNEQNKQLASANDYIF
jgi:hypothetical protein